MCANCILSMHVLGRATQRSTCIHKVLKHLKSFRGPLSGVDVLKMVGSNKLRRAGCMIKWTDYTTAFKQGHRGPCRNEDEAGGNQG